jgi:hypothetical protein
VRADLRIQRAAPPAKTSKTKPKELPPTPVCGVEGFAGSSVLVGLVDGVGDGFAVSEAEGVPFAVTVGELTGGAVTTLVAVGLGPAVGVVPSFFTRMLMTPAASTPAIAKARSLWLLLMANPPHESQWCDSIA